MVTLEVLTIERYDMDAFYSYGIMIRLKLSPGDTMVTWEKEQVVSLENLRVYVEQQPIPDIEIADGNALLYYIM